MNRTGAGGVLRFVRSDRSGDGGSSGRAYPARPEGEVSYRRRILSTDFARSSNSAQAGEDGAYSRTVRPLVTASARTMRCPMPGRTFLPSSSSEAGVSLRPGDGCSSGPSRARAGYAVSSLLVRRAPSALTPGPLSSGTDRGATDRRGEARDRRAASPDRRRRGVQAVCRLKQSSADSRAALTFVRNSDTVPRSSFCTDRESSPSPCAAQAARLCWGSASRAITVRSIAENSAARFPAMVDFPMPPFRPAITMTDMETL